MIESESFLYDGLSYRSAFRHLAKTHFQLLSSFCTKPTQRLFASHQKIFNLDSWVSLFQDLFHPPLRRVQQQSNAPFLRSTPYFKVPTPIFVSIEAGSLDLDIKCNCDNSHTSFFSVCRRFSVRAAPDLQTFIEVKYFLALEKTNSRSQITVILPS